MKYIPTDKKTLRELCDNLSISLKDIDTSKITDMSDLFHGVFPDGEREVRTDFSGIETWDVSNVVNMSNMFCHCDFNADLSSWNVSKVRDFKNIFYYSSFNGDISTWKISPESNYKEFLNSASIDYDNLPVILQDYLQHYLNRDFYYRPKTKEELRNLLSDKSINLGKIDTSLITDMSDLFSGIERNVNGGYNGIENWDVSNVTNMSNMFSGMGRYGYKHINGDLSKWDVSNVTNMESMFESCVFYGKIANWDVSKVENMKSMFERTKFDDFSELDLSNWNVSNVRNMAKMFAFVECNFNKNSESNLDISNWDVSHVTDMSSMFEEGDDLLRYSNTDLSKWDVSNVTNMEKMFCWCMANLDLSKWNVSNVRNMNSMFDNSHGEIKDLSKWDISNVKEKNHMFYCSSYKGDKPSMKRNKKITKHCYVNENGSANIYCVIPKEELKNIKGDLRIITGELSEYNFYKEYGEHESFQSAECDVINSLCDYLDQKNNIAKCKDEITQKIKAAYPDFVFTDKNLEFECELDIDYSEDPMFEKFEKYNTFNENGDFKCKFLVNYDCSLDFNTERDLTTEDDFDIDDEDYDDEDKRDDLKLEDILFHSLKDNLFKDNSVVKEMQLLEWDDSFEIKEELVQNQKQNKVKSKKMSL